MDWFWKRKVGEKVYLMHKGLFLLLCVGVLVVFFWTLLEIGDGDDLRVFVSCPSSSPTNPFGISGCRNPFFNSSNCGVKIPSNSSVCTTEFLMAGASLGKPTPWIYTYFWLIVWSFILLVLVVNHNLFNTGFFKGFEVKAL